MKWSLCISAACLLLGLAAACQRTETPNQTQTPTQLESKPAQATNPVATPGEAASQPKSEESKTVQPTNSPLQSAANSNEVAVIKTTLGEMVLAFWPDVAPNTVDNFKKLAKQGFYDGSAFHRIVKDFMIQGGDPLSKTDDASVGTGGPGYQIKAEFNNRPHVRGVISMARSQDPNSAGSQFFICVADASPLNGKYTAFGSLIKGDDVLGKIGDTPVTNSMSGERSKPLTRIGVESIKIVPADTVK